MKEKVRSKTRFDFSKQGQMEQNKWKKNFQEIKQKTIFAFS